MEEKEKLEKGIEKNKKVGRVCFSLADNAGTIGKVAVMFGAAFSAFGLICAVIAQILQFMMDSKKRKIRALNAAQKNK